MSKSERGGVGDQQMVRYMSRKLYNDAAAGVVRRLRSDIESVERKEEFLSLTPEKNNCLHIAARFGHEEFMRDVLSHCSSLLYQKNKRGENPLHVAARAGHLRVVKLLTDSFQRLHPPPSAQSIESNPRNSATEGEGIRSEEFPREADEGESTIQIQNQENITALTDSTQLPPISQSQSIRNSAAYTAGDDIITERSLREAEEGERPTLPMWSTQNQQNTTTLADSIGPLRSSQSGITAERSDMPIWLTQNHNCSTPLHEALRSKHEDVAMHLLDLDFEHVVVVVNAKGESPLYLAAEAGFIRVLTKILMQDRGSRVSTAGPEGQTPIHAAVFAASSESIKKLHESFPGLIRERDSYGKTAVYYATQSSSLKIMRLLLELDASSAYICDDEGLSPLLIAASLGQLSFVRAILDSCPASIESSDNGGSNALHLAVLNCTLSRFQELLEMPEVMTLINEPDYEGNTPLHLATKDTQYRKINVLLSTKRVDLTIMNNVGQTAFDLCILDKELSARSRKTIKKMRVRKACKGRTRPPLRFTGWGSRLIVADAKDMKQVANTQSVVAALLVTITFAAAFAIPGGYKDDGSPLLMHKSALKAFFISDSIALCLSMAALSLILRGTLRKNFLRQTVDISLGLISYALGAAMIAFVSGLYAVISIDSMGLAILVCIIGSSFYFLVLLMARFGACWTPFGPNLLRKQITGSPPPPPLND